MRQALQRIATGPTMSKDLTAEEARSAMRLVLEQKVDPVQSALFLIALRMKRESPDEMLGITQAIIEGAPSLTIECESLITLADPFDGYIRSLPASPFVPAVLAACGESVVTHGIDSIGPKYGLSVKRVLQAAEVQVEHSLQSAAECFGGSVGTWCYLDQSVVAPELENLQLLRDQMVKRPCITTIEKGLMPLKARRNHFVTGYVHKAYPDVYASLANAVGFDSAAFIKGIEGGVVPTVAQVSRYFLWRSSDDVLKKVRIVPEELNICMQQRAVDLPPNTLEINKCGVPDASAIDKLAKATAAEGLRALNGEKSVMHECIALGAAVALAGCRPITLKLALEEVREAMNSGAALNAFR